MSKICLDHNDRSISVSLDMAKKILQKKLEDGICNRLEVEIDPCSPLLWLQQQNHLVKTYWADREQSFEMAGIGETHVVSQTKELDYLHIFTTIRSHLKNAHKNLRYYGGICFSSLKKPDILWQPLGRYRFIIPQFEIFRQNQKHYLVCNFLFEEQRDILLKILDDIKFQPNPDGGKIPNLLSREDFPKKNDWQCSIENILNAKIEKIVLARKSSFHFQNDLNPIDLMYRLQKSCHNTFLFCFAPNAKYAFIGATPERLYRRNGEIIESEAIAGTRPRGKSREEDHKLRKDLLHSEKDIYEHNFVEQAIERTFAKLCKTTKNVQERNILALAQVQHLCSRFRGILANDICDSQILSHLHPTPAVGGFPTSAALEQINALEPFDRGWYAGPVGWITNNSAEFAVAIRSGLVHHKTLSLFSGAGIVKGSTASSEWKEIEAKLASFLKIFSSKTLKIQCH